MIQQSTRLVSFLPFPVLIYSLASLALFANLTTGAALFATGAAMLAMLTTGAAVHVIVEL